MSLNVRSEKFVLLLVLCMGQLLQPVTVDSKKTVSPATATNGTCAPWLKPENHSCTCWKNDFFDGKLVCSSYSKDIKVLDTFCMTYNIETGILEVGACIENCMNATKGKFKDKLYNARLSPRETLSSINISTCQTRFKRTGRLCGKCLPGYHPQAYSYNITCVPCPRGNANLWKYFVFSLTPLTCFYFLVLFFKINTTSSHLHGYIIFAQAIAMQQMARIIILTLNVEKRFDVPVKLLEALYGLWNLDFARMFDLGICLDMSPLSVITLDYVIAIYPFILTVLSYILIELHSRNFRVIVCLWKPFRCLFTLFRRNWDIRTSVIDAYATFFQLSCFKILCISFDLLIPTVVYNLEDLNSTKLALYYDGDVDYFGPEHLPYAITALLLMTFFAIFPVLLFLFYPCRWFQHLLNHCCCNSHILRTFVESHNGCYKDGTEPGMRDCRWFASLDLFSRFLLFIVFSFTLGSLYFPFAILVVFFVIVLITNVQPHKLALAHYSKVDVTFYCLLGLFYTAINASVIASIKSNYFTKGCLTVALFISIIPLIYISCLSIYWIFSRRKWGKTLINRIRAWKGGYHLEEDLPDRFLNPGNYI